jgi:hypothetical protein
VELVELGVEARETALVEGLRRAPLGVEAGQRCVRVREEWARETVRVDRCSAAAEPDGCRSVGEADDWPQEAAAGRALATAVEEVGRCFDRVVQADGVTRARATSFDAGPRGGHRKGQSGATSLPSRRTRPGLIRPFRSCLIHLLLCEREGSLSYLGTYYGESTPFWTSVEDIHLH